MGLTRAVLGVVDLELDLGNEGGELFHLFALLLLGRSSGGLCRARLPQGGFGNQEWGIRNRQLW